MLVERLIKVLALKVRRSLRISKYGEAMILGSRVGVRCVRGTEKEEDTNTHGVED
jgi:hypothetical protein